VIVGLPVVEDTVSLATVKGVAREKLKKHPSLVKQLCEGEPDQLPYGPAAFTKLLTYWQMVFAAWEEERAV
jgi:hypothetical protein